ncbi:MAG: DNA-binding protein [Actinobacteria bacterium]|nr:DNA-binding protein [Actinomycetota bacterium]MBU1865299.1 DNA-binding protein [Actinomycetota bacterium]
MKTRPCASGDARKRITAARKFLEVAELYLNDSDLEGRRVAVSNAVHAGIAASDAICCAVLGEHAVGDDHQAAAKLLASVGRQATEPARALGALLRVKSKAQYQTSTIGKPDAAAAVRRAAALVEAAETIVFSTA